MTCTKGRANPNAQTKLRLFSAAAGYCQRPECRRHLFSEEGVKDYHIAEMAHIFAAMDHGPRADVDLDHIERASYANLILLCPSCHTEIDKAPEEFTDEIVQQWKASHTDAIKNVLGVAEFNSRNDARLFIEPILRINKTIFNQYGPNNDYHENPEAEEAQVWQRKMLSQIIPNNQKILLTLDANSNLANKEELEIIEIFRQHVDDLIERHLGDDQHQASRFPEQMSKIFSDD